MAHNHSHSDHEHSPEHDHARAGSGHEGHSHAGHAHVSVNEANERRVLLAMWLTGGFMLVEAAGGVFAGSLALIADAGHMLTDTGALVLAWLAMRLARKPADDARSYGYHRAEILAAFLNGLIMIALSIWIVFEAMMRLQDPVPVLGKPMLLVAVCGLAVNIASFALLHRAGGGLNLRGAALHVAGDMLGSAAAIIAAIVILLFGFMPIDPLLSILVALLIIRSAWAISRDASHILMEGTPSGLDPDVITADLVKEVPGVRGVHHVHAWSLTSNNVVVTLHATLMADAESAVVLAAINARLAKRFGVNHATVQIEPEECPDTHH